MKFKEKLKALLASLKIQTLDKDNYSTVAEAWKNEHGTEFSDALAEAQKENSEDENASAITETVNSVNAFLADETPAENGIEGNNGEDKKPEGTEEDQKPEGKTDLSDLIQSVNKLLAFGKEAKEKLNVLSNKAQDDKPMATIEKKLSVHGSGTTDKHLFGIENKFYDMSARWNRIAANPAAANNPMEIEEDTLNASLMASFKDFASGVASRFRTLSAEKKLNAEALIKGEGLSFGNLGDAGLGDQYLVLRQDALIAHLIQIEGVSHLFATRSGVKDRELITNAFFTSVSQAYQKGGVYKGGADLQPEMGHVDDAMMKHFFDSYKDIERLYIGYLNTSGSDPIKWSMIEWMLVHMYTQMINEQNERRIMGIYAEPATGVAGHHMNAGTGVIYTIMRYVHENKLLPIDSAECDSYTSADMLTVVQVFVDEIRKALPKGKKIESMVLYLNQNHRPWFKKNVRAAYGKDTDFTGPNGDIVPDENIVIRWVPNMGQLPLMFMTFEGNIQFLEFVSGEMLAVKMIPDMESVRAWSTWKEGTTAMYAGRKFETLAKLKENKFKDQSIFVNKPVIKAAADATTIDMDNDIFHAVTVNNTQATVITDIANAVEGVAYIIECGGTTNASKISKAGKFADVTAWTPTAVGDYIMVGLNVGGTKFFEYERCVGGVRTINASIQPNIPGAR